MGATNSTISNTEQQCEEFIHYVIKDMKLNNIEFKDIEGDLKYINKLCEVSIDKAIEYQRKLIYEKYINKSSSYAIYQENIIPYPSISEDFRLFSFLFAFGLCKKTNLSSEILQLLNYLYSSITISSLKKFIKRYLYIFLNFITSKLYAETSYIETIVDNKFKLDDIFKRNMKNTYENEFSLEKINKFYDEIIIDIQSIFYIIKKRKFEEQVKDSDTVNEEMIDIFLSKYSYIFNILSLRSYFIRKYN